jgi:uncharacterized membrane protein YhaH (DUF805 family)
MSPFSQIITMLFDPRGRTNREELLVSAGILVALEFAATFVVPIGDFLTSPLHMCLKGFALWVGCVALIRRLHDCGMSGWTLLGGFAALCMWTAVVALSALFVFGRNILVPASPGYIVVLGLVMMPVVGAALWLHLQAGELHSNRFGSVSSGFWTKKRSLQTEIA